MNILLVENAEKWSGACYEVMLLGKNLIKKGYNVTVVSKPDTIVSEKFRDKGLEVFECNILNDGDIMAFFKLLSFFKKYKPDFVEIYNQKAYWIVGTICKLKNIKCFINRNLNWLPKNKAVFRFLLKFISPTIIAVSNAVKQTLINGLAYPSAGIKVINPVIEKETYINNNGHSTIREEFNISNDINLFGYIGRISPEKGITYLIDAFSKTVKDGYKAKLMLVGDGKEKEVTAVKNAIDTYNLNERIIMTGFRSDIVNILNGIDVYIQPSLQEAFPISILEAMACGKTVISTNVGGVPEIITHKENGFIVSPKNTEELREAMITAIKSKSTHNTIKEKARETILNNFTEEQLVNNYINLFKEETHT
ncbi:MAG: glycosyltransferase family 4 protein [Spirochaetota bacterium]